jgi:Spy/CpxP family protein refolding chaperone
VTRLQFNRKQRLRGRRNPFVTPMIMSRKLFVCLTLSLVTQFGWVAAAGAQSFKWWKDDRFQKELALTVDQSSRIEGVFQAAQPTLRAQKRALDKLEDELSVMIHDAKVDDPELEQFINRVEAARADLSKTRTMMLVRMRRILTVDQSTKLHQLFEQDEKQRHGRPHGPSSKQ